MGRVYIDNGNDDMEKKIKGYKNGKSIYKHNENYDRALF